MTNADVAIAIYGTGDISTKAAVALLDDYLAALPENSEPPVVSVILDDTTSDDVAFRMAQYAMQNNFDYYILLGCDRKAWMKEVLTNATAVFNAPPDDDYDTLLAGLNALHDMELVVLWAWDDDDPRNIQVCKLLEETETVVTPLDYSEGLYPIEFDVKLKQPEPTDEEIENAPTPAAAPKTRRPAVKAGAGKKAAQKREVEPEHTEREIESPHLVDATEAQNILVSISEAFQTMKGLLQELEKLLA